jgi:uncharacterized membrane protein YraQ (UPF0718 family)
MANAMVDSFGLIGFWGLALALGVLVCVKRGRAETAIAVRTALDRSLRILPRIAVAILTAGFVARLIPSDVVVEHIGPDSGFSGTLIATLVGGFIPAGPIVSFPLVVVLSNAGAGMVQLIALLTAWSVFAVHRIIIYEIPLMGARFSMIRLAASLPLPFVAAGLTSLILSVIH